MAAATLPLMYGLSAPGCRSLQRFGPQAICRGLTIFACVVLALVPTRDALGNNGRLADSVSYLSQRGVELELGTSAAESAKRLKPLLVDAATLRLTKQYLTDLRADDYGKRETASRELAKLRVPIDPLLALPRAKAGADAGNLEYTWRLQQILAVRRSLALEDQLYHALVVIELKPVTGLIGELLSTASALEGGDSRLLGAAERAIGATVSESDKSFLRSVLQSGSSATKRQRATMALAKLLAESDSDGLQELLSSDDVNMQLAAVRGATLAGDTSGVSQLVSLLEHSSVAIRCDAADLLFRCTGKDFGYAGYDEPSNRTSSIAKWNRWLNTDGHRDRSAAAAADTSEGRVLVGIRLKEPTKPREGRKRGGKKMAERSNVLEFTPSGSIRWHMRSSDLRGGTAVAAIPLANGARAIAFGQSANSLQQNMSIRFFDGNGQPLGSLSGLAGIPALGSNDDGNLLVAAANEIVEVGVLGNLVRRTVFGNTAEPIDYFTRARGGRLIIVSSQLGTVREYSSEGALLLEQGNLKRPVYARRLRDGSLLVAQKQDTEPAVLSFAPTGEVAWTFTPSKEIGAMTAVAALPNGNALFGASTGLYEVGASGQITRTWINGSVSFVYAD